MSKFGLKVADKTIYGVKNANQAIDLIEAVVKQFLGGSWTQYEPRCPICNDKLKDFQKHMNRPIGECVNKECQSTIFPSDYLGKIMDIISEVRILREEEELAKKKHPATTAIHPVYNEPEDIETEDTSNIDTQKAGKIVSPTPEEVKKLTKQIIGNDKSAKIDEEGDISSKKMYAGLPVIDW